MKNSFGAGLLEVLVAITISAAAGVLLIKTFVENQGLYFEQSSKITQGFSINSAYSEISESIKKSSAVAPANLIGSPQFTTDNNTLVLELPSIDSSGNVINQTFDYIVITREGQNLSFLKKKLFPNPLSQRSPEDKLLATNVSSFTLSYKDQAGNQVSPTNAQKVSFNFELSQKAGYANQQSSAAGEINLRNN
ncbi:MAG: hypothetical protein ACD_30C00112G0042 [uncultured bacterium]|uniref:Uncharacterized protein n=4 Tax=Candidatus Daviesiibacteriota TaxID=1752718 RepID=A0A0G0EUE0_9BACT|nr:MAG: hypothetical protein ACD_30C00112G0042 [uncultured bacterium]KKQ10538.1 MAG: hypothetical protein US19_C0003G0033 [Candidatus Daviesbacteria bacterium GW2011_GWB1_36_5]KKQ15281.1 MAG: hypothetical protein US28_C0019G0014 [Candidatus Daviesbacteria bacterium GW2011_GWA1_36_8]OGE17201.1 MAG: hypothetical protein A2858_00660 [Candidatus Daviesbacteria bacterium RIFCSPHIGHO2_01_FULL_36_37]OGE35982.1 MAG: hypothetical protein A3E66_01655 [Candidatus Daviesbacteria bacterium RIFCSPHIGHO2_12_F